MSERVYNAMVPIISDMVAAIAGPEAGQKIANAPIGPAPFDETLPISPKENMKLLMEHKVPKYLPVSGDTILLCPDVVQERSPGNKPGKDWFGAYWTFETSIGATMVKPGTEMLDSLEGWKDKVVFPDLDAIDWEESAQGISKYYDPNRMSDWRITIGLFERLHALLGMENALYAVIAEEDLVAEFFEAMTEHKVKLIKKLTSHYRVDMICYQDDWGFNTNGFFPVDTFKRLFLGNMKKIVDAVHDGGAYFNMHSDGRVEHYIPYMVELGMDMWNPAQSVNDLAWVKKEFGDRLVLNGGMDELWTDAKDADEAKLRAYTRDKVDLLGKGGGFFANPSTFTMRNKGIMLNELKTYGREFYNK